MCGRLTRELGDQAFHGADRAFLFKACGSHTLQRDCPLRVDHEWVRGTKGSKRARGAERADVQAYGGKLGERSGLGARECEGGTCEGGAVGP